jgi:hypothetical protein
MEQPAIPLQVKYWGVVPSSELKSVVAAEAERLRPYSAALAMCKLEVGQWHLHRGEGSLYRVTLDVELEQPKDVLNTKFESPLGADAQSMPGLLRVAFEAALRQVAARVGLR